MKLIRKIIQKIFGFFHNIFGKIRKNLELYKKEDVLKFFIIIIIISAVAATLFYIFEHEKVVASTSGGDQMTLFDKAVTSFYWAVVTVATLGYGDIAPGTSLGRIIDVVYIFAAMIIVAFFSANLSSALTTKKLMERRGIMDVALYSDHFVICGWKQAMAKLLSEVIYNNTMIKLNRIIIIANIEPDTLELFKQQYPEFNDVMILRGEHYNETLLKKACVENASKVLILADETTAATVTEKDSKTVMTAMTLRSISQNIRICAELLDIKFEKYLQSANVEEIIRTNEYSQALIASSFTKVGVTNAVNDLLNLHTNAFIVTHNFPDTYYGAKYSDLRDYFKQSDNLVLIGLLENIGSYVERKTEAVRDAQKTADISKLIDNLKQAKNMETNLSNMIPPDDYTVPKNSVAIVIGKK